jgi:hypothetical protein
VTANIAIADSLKALDFNRPNREEPSDERAIWCRAEALGLRIENRDSAFFPVKNSEGATVVRTGVTTALVSTEKCS